MTAKEVTERLHRILNRTDIVLGENDRRAILEGIAAVNILVESSGLQENEEL